MNKKLLSTLVITSLYLAGVFFGVESVGAARELSASGNLDPSAVIGAHRDKMEALLKDDWNVVRRDFPAPESTAMNLKVSRDGVVSGWGKVGPVKSDFWAMTSTGMTTRAIGQQDFEYWFGLIGKQTGNILSGEAVVKYRSRLTTKGTRTYRTTWKGTDNGVTIKGVIEGVREGKGMNFSLVIGERGAIEMDEDVKNELEGELEKSGIVVVEGERGEWKTNLLGVNQAYVIVDGERQPLTDNMILEPGMEIETEGEDGLAVFTTSSGEHIRLQGDGTKVTLMTVESIEEEGWKQLVSQYGKKDTVMLMRAGQMVVKYETKNESGLWNAAFRSDQDAGTGSSVVGFARNVYTDASGKEQIGIEDDDPVELVFENHSVVEYEYYNEIIKVKVYEGEAVVYRVDLESGEKKELKRVKAGESISIDLAEYEKGTGEEGLDKGTFDVSVRSEAVEAMMSKNWLKYIWPWGLVVAVGAGLFGVIFFKFIRKPSR